MDLSTLGRILLIVAAVVALVGVILLVVGRFGGLPGDVSFGSRSFRVFVPLGTSILVSVVLTVLLNLFLRR